MTSHASGMPTHVVTNSTRCRRYPFDAEVHAGEHRAAREDRAEQRREHALEDERRLDEPVGRPHQAHDSDLSPSRIRRQPDRRRDQQHGGDQHQHGDAHRDIGRDGQRREQRLEILQLILHLFDALHPVNASMMTSDWLLVDEVDPVRLVQLVGRDDAGVVLAEQVDDVLVRLVPRLEPHVADERRQRRTVERRPAPRRAAPASRRRRCRSAPARRRST